MQQKNETILVKPELMEILNSFGTSHCSNRSKSKSARALAALKVKSKSKKRSWEEFKKSAFAAEPGLVPKETSKGLGRRMKMS